jgi:HTH-type transcriptional regulator/antitoxin HigA
MATDVKVPLRSDLAIPPGETLLDVLDDRGMTVQELAARMGVEPLVVQSICDGDEAITASLALAMEGALSGLSAEFWLTLQSNYELSLARMAGSRR